MIHFHLCQVVTGIHNGMYGGRGRGARQYHTYKGKKYLVRHQDNHKFIWINNRKVIIQKGGGYKGITFMSPTFIEFISRKILIPVKNTNSEAFRTATIIYDEMSELAPNSNKNIVFIYDFLENTRHIFYIDTSEALISCYAEQTLDRNISLTPYEQATYEKFQATIEMMTRSSQDV